MQDDLRDLLFSLQGVRQNPKHHPEGDALFHSLQAFDHARRATTDRVLWAAALLHDVGKAESSAGHAAFGAELLDGLVAPRITWLVSHHLDLLEHPVRTKHRLRGTPALRDLQLLRAWDVGGRDPRASTVSVDDAIEILFERDLDLLGPDGAAVHDDAEAY